MNVKFNVSHFHLLGMIRKNDQQFFFIFMTVWENCKYVVPGIDEKKALQRQNDRRQSG